MFIDEAKIAVQLSHANIGQIFELGRAEDSYFIAMEFVQGRDLRTIFDRARRQEIPLDIPMCCHIVKEICEALEYAHNKRNDRGESLNLIHRDVSPQNIIISYEGEAKLIDFGIAKAAGKANTTQAGILKGKFGYMSPEQVRGKTNIDRRSDLFSLAVVLFEILTLERCFQGESDFSTLEKVRAVDIRRPSSLNREIPPELERIILRGLARDPESRYQSASDFQDALQKFLYQSGAFYSRKNLSAFMRRTFAREFEKEQARLTEFRDYAQEHIPEARRASSSSPQDLDKTRESEPGDLQFQASPSSLSWEDEELETAVWDRSPSQILAELGKNPGLEPPTLQYTPSPHRARGGLSGNSAPFSVSPPAPYYQTPPSFSQSNPHRTQEPQVQAKTHQSLQRGQILQRENTLSSNYPKESSRLWTLALITFLSILIASAAVSVVFMMRNRPSQASLVIDTMPSITTLFINGEQIQEGRSPFTLQNLKAAEYRLTITAEGHEPLDRLLSLEEGEEKRVLVQLTPKGANTGLGITTHPSGARVYANNEYLGESPLEAQKISAGRCRLRIEKKGYLNWNGTVRVEKGKFQKVQEIMLYPQQISLSVQPDPKEASLKLRFPDGRVQEISSAPVLLENRGRVVLIAEAKNYETLERPILQSLKRRQELLLELEPLKSKPNRATPKGKKRRPLPLKNGGPKQPPEVPLPPPAVVEKEGGYLRLQARPPARAYIGGEDLGWTPVLSHALPAGSHQITLVRDEAPAFRETITVLIEPGKTTFRHFIP